MENSHHVAKTTYSRHTQHSGGKSKKNPLKQTFQHWYRIIGHRFRNRIEAEKAPTVDHEEILDVEAKIEVRRVASINSSATAHNAEWRAKCIRKGSRWIPLASEDTNNTEPETTSQ